MAQRQFSTDDTSLWVDRYGNGSDGPLTVSGSTTVNFDHKSACTGTSGASTLSATNSNFAAGQLILIHQTRGTNAGVWELNKISSYVAGTITLSYTLINTYSSGAQVIKIPQYTDVTVNSGVTLTINGWDGSVGGLVVIFATGTINIAGTITAVGKGFRNNALTGGVAQGEGSAGAPSYSTSANGNGGGGGGNATDSEHVEGGNSGGGGSLNAGTAGATRNTGTGGGAGSAVGSADMTTFTVGGASGYGGNGWGQSNALSGVNGSGCVILVGKTVTVSGSIAIQGQNGQSSASIAATGGSGAGRCLIKGQVVTIGSNLINAAGGTGGTCTGSFGGSGGNGGAGNTRVEYSGSISGTTTQTLSSEVDNVLAELPALDNYSFLM